MNSLREKAYRLRIKGKSYNEIYTELGVPKSTSATWFGKMVLSDTAKARLRARVAEGVQNGLVKRNILQTAHAVRRAKEVQSSAKKDMEVLTKKELLLVGTALYWAEGYKRLKIRDGVERTYHAISFVNADPKMLFVFIRFLEEILELPRYKIRVSMRLYPHINESNARKYWMKETGLSESHFRTTSYMTSPAGKSIRPHNRLPWGTLHIEVSDTSKFHKILGWIEGMKDKL